MEAVEAGIEVEVEIVEAEEWVLHLEPEQKPEQVLVWVCEQVPE